MKTNNERFEYKPSLFWRYFSLLAAIASIFIVALLASTGQYRKLIRNSYSNVVQESFYQNCNAFSQEIAQTRSLIITIQSSEYYMDLCTAHPPLSVMQQYKLNQMRQFFARQCNLQTCMFDGFIASEGIQLCLTTNSIIEEPDELLDSYFQFEDDISLYDTLQNRTIQNRYTVLPAARITINEKNSNSYLTLLSHPISSKFTYGFFCPTDKVLQAFGMGSLPDGSYLQIVSATDETLFAYNDRGNMSDYIVFTHELPSLQATASLGIPKAYFSDILEQSLLTVQLIFIASLFIGIALCVIFSYIGVKPFHSLIAEHTMLRAKSKNELDVINDYLNSTKYTNQLLKNTLLSNLITRALYALPIGAEESSNLTAHFPIFEIPQHLIIVQDCTPPQRGSRLCPAFDTLLQQLPAGIISEHISISELCILIRDDLFSEDTLQQSLMEMNIDSQEYPRFICGVSASFTGLADLSNAVRQARFVLPKDKKRMIGFFVQCSDENDSSVPQKVFELKHLEQGLNCWNEAEVLNIIRDFQFTYANHDTSPEEIFYNILHLLRVTAQAGSIDFSPYENVTYMHNTTDEVNLKVLEKIAQDLFNKKEQMQTSAMQQLCETLVQYVKDNYSSPILSVSVLAQKFCVSEHFVYKSILSVSGMSFPRLLLETRMTEAGRLLRETDMSNIDISEHCGYTTISTFYRNFRSYYSKTPAAYKDSFSNIK